MKTNPQLQPIESRCATNPKYEKDEENYKGTS